MLKKICALFLVAVLFIPSSYAATTRPLVTVQWVVDGDSFKTETGEKIRLIGVDTPEYQPWKHHVDYYGKEAAEYAQKLLYKKKVFLEYDVDKKDKYDRTLAYVYLENGRFVNEELVSEGYARAKYYKPNGKYYGVFKKAQQEAKSLKKGLWGTPKKAARLAKSTQSV